MAVKSLHVPVHNASILLCDNKKEAKDIIQKYLYKDDSEVQDALTVARASCAFTFDSDGRVDWVLLYSPRNPVHIAHEAVHAAVSALEAVGVTISTETDEVLAYFVDHIVGARWDRKGWVPYAEWEAAHQEGKKKRG